MSSLEQCFELCFPLSAFFLIYLPNFLIVCQNRKKVPGTSKKQLEIHKSSSLLPQKNDEEEEEKSSASRVFLEWRTPVHWYLDSS